LFLRRILKLKTAPLSTRASDTVPDPVSLAAEICSGLGLVYPAGNGPVSWSLAHRFFPIDKNDQESETLQEISEENAAIQAEEAAPCE